MVVKAAMIIRSLRVVSGYLNEDISVKIAQTEQMFVVIYSITFKCFTTLSVGIVPMISYHR